MCLTTAFVVLIAGQNVEAEDQYDHVRDNWKNYIVGGENYETNDTDIQATIKFQDKKTKRYWETMNKGENKVVLWDNLSKYPDSSQLTRTYENIRYMSRSYQTKGSEFYQNQELKKDIIKALDWMYENKYNENKTETFNWWDWEVGAPTALGETVIIMYDELSNEQIQKYMKPLDKFSPNAEYYEYYQGHKLSIANVAFKSKVVFLHGVILKDHSKISHAKEQINKIISYSDEVVGFHADGSFIEHKKYAYNGGYGLVVFKISTELMTIFEDTPWYFSGEKKKIVTDWAFSSFKPFIYKGALMDMVRGRALATNDYEAGDDAVLTILSLSEIVNGKDSEKLKALYKQSVLDKDSINYPYESIRTTILQKALISDTNTLNIDNAKTHYQFSVMDRVVHIGGDYTFGLSMSSSRIANYESINGDNLKGWHTGAGMLYLYNGDYEQYRDAFWYTIDSNRLPGTTVEQKEVKDNTDRGYLNSVKWVGGSQLSNKYGAVGMEIQPKSSTLTGRKSWFMFDDEVVSLGAGITNKENLTVETIVENRKISKEADEQLLIDGIKSVETLGTQEVKKNPKWILLQGKKDKANIGYFFPSNQTVNIKRETREGNLKEIYEYGGEGSAFRNYLTMWIDHGEQVSDGMYSYVILPNKTKEELESYASNPDIDILRNTKSVQAVRDKKLGVTGINFWDASSLEDITVYQASSIVKEQKGDIMTLAISDPTQSQNKIEVEVAGIADRVISKDENIKVLQTSPILKIEVDTTNTKGKSSFITLEMNLKMEVEKVYPSADTFVRDGDYASQNYGRHSVFLLKNSTAGYNRIGYIKFKIAKNDLPTGSNVYLNLYDLTNKEFEKKGSVNIHSSVVNWIENETSWNNKPKVKKSVCNMNLNVEGNWKTCDITSFIFVEKSETMDIKTYGFTLSQTEKNVITTFATKESSISPYLLIVKPRS